MIPLAVFDCMVYVQAAIRNRGPAAACLAAVERGAAVLFVSDPILYEVQDVLSRPRIGNQLNSLTPAFVSQFIGRVQFAALFVQVIPAVVTLTRDPKDEKYLNLAVAAGASYVVTRDRDMLDLTTATDADAVAFRTNHPTIEVVTPPAFLARLAPPTP